MIIRYPAYYEAFRCIADKCPDSCCKEWDVAVDEASAARYLEAEGDLGQTLRKYLYQDGDGDWYFAIEEGRCPFWRPDGLCRIQAEQGHDALCKTCREFPRLTHDYGAFVEWGLSLSCPAAAPLILKKAGAAWKSVEVPGGEAPEYDPEDMALLLETREEMLGLLADEQYSVSEVLALGLLYGSYAQARLDGEELEAFAPEGELAFGRRLAKQADAAQLLNFYVNLEILTEQWKTRLENPTGAGEWDERLRALACYGIERYWLQAISDLDLVGRTKMVILSCVLVHFLGGDVTETAQLYAKEIENDEDNVEAILNGAYASPALTDDKLLGWLLGGEI